MRATWPAQILPKLPEGTPKLTSGVSDRARPVEAWAVACQRPSLQDMIAATERFRQAIGMDQRIIDTSKAAFDTLNEIPSLEPEL